MFLPPSGTLLFRDAFGPPMEQRRGVDALPLVLELRATRELQVFEFLTTGEVTIDEAGVGQRPRDQQVFGGLELRRIGRQNCRRTCFRRPNRHTVHQRTTAVARCRWSDPAQAHVSDVHRQVSRFVVAAWGQNRGRIMRSGLSHSHRTSFGVAGHTGVQVIYSVLLPMW